MTIDIIKKAAADNGGLDAILALYFDNDKVDYYLGSDIITDDLFVTMGDHEFIKCKSFILNKETGRYDIPVWVYKNVDDVQGIVVLDNNVDRAKVHDSDFLMR